MSESVSKHNRNQVFGALTTQATIILVGSRPNALEVMITC